MNTTLTALARRQAKRRLQTITIPPLPSACSAACEGMDCLWSDTQHFADRLNVLTSGGGRQ